MSADIESMLRQIAREEALKIFDERARRAEVFPDPPMTAQEAAVHLGTSAWVIYDAHRRGELRGYTVGRGRRGLRFLRSELEAYRNARAA